MPRLRSFHILSKISCEGISPWDEKGDLGRRADWLEAFDDLAKTGHSAHVQLYSKSSPVVVWENSGQPLARQ
jgi:hypothetical protein